MSKENFQQLAWTIVSVALIALCAVAVINGQPLTVPPLPDQPTTAETRGLATERGFTGVIDGPLYIQGDLDTQYSLDVGTSATVGGGYGSTGCTFSAAGVVQCDGAATAGGALTGDSAVIGGGYGSTGATISSAGVGQFDGALTTGGTLTAADIAFGGGYGSSGCTGSGAGALSCDGLLTGALGATVTGATVNLNASSNFGVNVNTGTSTGALALGGGSGTVVVNSSDWDINATGDATGIGAVTMNGLLTGSLGETITGAAVNLNADSNFGVNINTGTSTGALALGGGSGTVAVNSTVWDISTAGAVTGLGDVTFATGLAGGADIASAAAAADTAGQATDVLGQAGGAAGADQVGQAGGPVSITAGAGSAKDGAGATDGDGGDVVLLGGAKGGSTGGTEVDGIVRVGSPTVGSTKATNVLAVGGAFEVDGATRLDGTLAANSSSTFGGGYGTTGCSISDAGVLQCNGGATIDGVIAGAGEGSVVYNTLHDVTIAEINAGHTIVTVPATRQFRLVDVTAIAYGGACAAVTTVDLKAGAVFLATYAQANLTQSTQLRTDTAGVTTLADGASFTAQTAGDDVTVVKAGADTTTCTGVRFVLSYALE